MIENIKSGTTPPVIRNIKERVRTETARKIIWLVLPKRFTRRIKIADNEKSSSGPDAKSDSEKILKLYSSLRIGRSGPINIKPARIFTATRNIGRLRRKAVFISRSYSKEIRNQSVGVSVVIFPVFPAKYPDTPWTSARKTMKNRLKSQFRVISKMIPNMGGASAAKKYPKDCDMIDKDFVCSAVELLRTHKSKEIGKLINNPIFPRISQMMTRGPESRASAVKEKILRKEIASRLGRKLLREVAK